MAYRMHGDRRHGRLTPDDRLAWLLRVSRRLGANGYYRTQSRLLRDFQAASTRKVTPGTLSRWESGKLRAPHSAVRRYEELLELPPNQLVSVIDTTYRYATSAEGASGRLARQPIQDDALLLRRQQELLDLAWSDALMGGAEWDDLTWLLTTTSVMLPTNSWTELAERLLSEMIISDGIRWHQRYEAFNRLLSHPISQHAAIAACVSLGADRSNQVVIETVSALDFSRHHEANAAILSQLLNPTSDQAQQGALLACFRKVRFGHFNPEQTRELISVLHDLTHSSTKQDRSRSLAVEVLYALRAPRQMLRSGAARVQSGLAGHEGEREIAINRITSLCLAHTPDLPDAYEDEILPLLIEEMLYALSWDVRLMASSLLAVSPYRPGISSALFDEFRTEKTLLGNPDWVHVLLSALRFVGGERERALLEQMVMRGGVPESTAVAAAYSIGHLYPEGGAGELQAAMNLNAARWESTRSPRSAAILAGLVYSAGVSGQSSILAAMRDELHTPAPLRAAAGWWLDLPSYVIGSARM